MQSLDRHRYVVGLAASCVCVVAAMALALEEVKPTLGAGCGTRGPCGKSRSAWKKVGAWPSSFLGAAYSAAMASAWLRSRRRGPSTTLRWLAIAGAACSAGFLLLLAIHRQFCPYCLAVHLANLVFAGLVFCAPANPHRARRDVNRIGVVFGVVLAGLAAAHSSGRRLAQAAADEEMDRSVAAIRAAALRPGQDEDAGRYRLGPAGAPVHLVVFTNHRCPACTALGRTLDKLVASHPGFSLSIRHIAHCDPTTSPGPACLAARAAEAAGILADPDAFWKMHRYLSTRRQPLDAQEIPAALNDAGLPHLSPVQFLETMEGDEVANRLRGDSQAAKDLDIRRTPSIVVNGVELRGWQRPGALAHALAALLEKTDR